LTHTPVSNRVEKLINREVINRYINTTTGRLRSPSVVMKPKFVVLGEFILLLFVYYVDRSIIFNENVDKRIIFDNDCG